ncbi:DUF2163 domain-containing protein [Hyphomonas sp. WL0036]|uniref:DUF2163 domain-containing protein n=1 Tax=Hyphomonas sediminis TaxID=2866160 RepID=UPI001C80D984|nr:DUF2163 domain-containing protein [Hyphomonas sediminis]MBY9067291.1 DUF2163 domain-containing protein [Hyphomonas sediminis]
MREISEEFAARLASGVTTTCLCWRIARGDGFVLRLTEYDGPLTVGGETFLPGTGLEGVEFVQTAGLAPGRAAARGALSHEAITEADLEAGLWDGARVDVWRVDWQAPEHRAHVWAGRLAEVTRGALGFEAALVSLKADLERPVGRIYARRCDAVLGDGRCGVDTGAFPGVACDHRFETCRDVFGNADRFRGFPHLPGADFMLAGPAASGNDGGKR